MGYFSNGTEGMMYEEMYCLKCRHLKRSGCPVRDIHLWYAYELCNSQSDAKKIIDILIPRSEDGLSNEKCSMFIKR